MEFLKDPPFWTAASLGIFIIILIILKVPGMALKALDGRAASIRAEIDEARRLRDEANELLEGHKRRQSEAKNEAEAMIAQARTEAQRAAEEARADLAAVIERRRKQAEEKIARAEEQAAQDIRAYAASVSVSAARRFIGAQMDERRSANLVDAAIAQLPERLRGK